MPANTGIIHGGDIMLFYNTGTAETPIWTPFAHQKGHSVELGDTEIRKVTSKNMGKKPKIKLGADDLDKIPFNALRTYDGVSFFDMKDMKETREQIQIKIAGRPSTDEDVIEVNEEVGDKYLEGYGYITSLKCEDPEDSESTIQGTITIDGGLETKTIEA